MKSKSSLILEGLLHDRLNESYASDLGVSFEDVPTVRDSRKLQKTVSQALTAKYQKVFQEFGGMGVDVDIYTSDDDDMLVDDAVQTLGIALVFDSDVKDKVRDIQKTIQKFMKNYPDFKYEKSDNSFWFEVESYEDIIDVFDTIQRTDRVNLGNAYRVVDVSDAEANFRRQNKEWKDERDSLEREYNRSRL